MRRTTHWTGAIIAMLPLAQAVAAPPEGLPEVGSIDFFGLRKVSEAEVRARLPFKEGDRLTDDRVARDGSAIARTLGVAEITLAYICCTPDQKFIVYVGVAESPPPARPPAPSFSGTARLPEEMIQANAEFESQLIEGVKSGTPEDRSQGHAFFGYPPLRAAQEKFAAYARGHVALVREVLATSSDASHRALAAMILGYAPDKRAAAAGLAAAVADTDAKVRNNATRALGVIAEYSAAHPDLGIHIDPAPFIEFLNAMTWADRNKGLMILWQLTASREPALLAQLRDRARPALIDMCRWKNPGHSIAACVVLRRVESLPDVSAGDLRAEVLDEVGADVPAPPSIQPEPRNR